MSARTAPSSATIHMAIPAPVNASFDEATEVAGLVAGPEPFLSGVGFFPP